MPKLVTVTSKLQITIPKKLSDHLGLHVGDKVEVSIRNSAMVVTPNGEHKQPQAAAHHRKHKSK